MIKVMCQTEQTIKLGELTPFQGDLKKRTKRDINGLMTSISAEGLLMPFAVWQHDGVNHLLDGHGRLAALTELALKDDTIATQQFPVLFIEADTEEQARKALLQITSSYGKINKQGAITFCAKIPEYHAPAVNKFLYSKPRQRKLNRHEGKQVIRIAVPEDKAQAVLDLFKQVDYIEIIK